MNEKTKQALEKLDEIETKLAIMRIQLSLVEKDQNEIRKQIKLMLCPENT